MNTLQYYEKYSKELIEKYNSIDTLEIYSLFQKYIHQNDMVLDIGFGSGRDLNYIRENISKNVFGIDGSQEFVKNIQKDIFYKNRINHSILPKINSFNKHYDVIISIAVFMHLNRQDINKTIKNIYHILNDNGYVIISYSTQSRKNDARVFYEISKDIMTKLFENNNFQEVETIVNNDNLDRSIEWVTQVFKKYMPTKQSSEYIT